MQSVLNSWCNQLWNHSRILHVTSQFTCEHKIDKHRGTSSSVHIAITILLVSQPVNKLQSLTNQTNNSIIN